MLSVVNQGYSVRVTTHTFYEVLGLLRTLFNIYSDDAINEWKTVRNISLELLLLYTTY